MGKSLMDIPVFAESIKNSTRVLGEVSLDVMSCILDDTARVTDIVQNSLATIVIELALIDVLHRVGLQPDGIIGLSLAEFGCGYADGAMSARQTLLTAYQFASIIAREHQGKHAMAAICMTNEQFKERSPKGIHIGFDGGNISGIGGMKDDVIDFMDELKAQDISGNLVDTGGIAFHTSLIAGCRDEVSMATEKLFPQPRKRSPRWLSTSIPLKSWNTASPVLDSQYYINNVFEVANLIQVVAFIPQDAILVEVGPNRFLLSFLKHEVGDDAILVPLLEGDNNNHNLDVFLGGLARIHAHGHHVDIEKLFIS
ncbi:Fatty acid synthase [Halotydeus destructor]|nr:Fatty acid synthase [Halotydeus destructor]